MFSSFCFISELPSESGAERGREGTDLEVKSELPDASVNRDPQKQQTSHNGVGEKSNMGKVNTTDASV